MLDGFHFANWCFPFHRMGSHHSAKWLPPQCQCFLLFSKLDPTHFAALLNPTGKPVAAHFATWSDPGSKLATPQISDWILHPAQTAASLAALLPDGNHLSLLTILIIQVQKAHRIVVHESHASPVAGSVQLLTVRLDQDLGCFAAEFAPEFCKAPFKGTAAEQVSSSSFGTLPCCPRCLPDPWGGLLAANSVSI
jgi:hypothetical protein